MRLFLSVLAILVVCSSLAWQNPATVDWKDKVQETLLVEAAQHSKVDFVIEMKEQADLLDEARKIKGKEAKAAFVFTQLTQLAASSQQPVKAILERRGEKYQSLFIVNAIKTSGSIQLIKEIALLDEVKSIIEDPLGTVEKVNPVDETPNRDPQTLEWGVERINADDVWALGFKGEGVVIGGEDTGYKWDHPALIDKYRGWDGNNADHNYNWHDAIHELNDLHNYPDTLPSNNDCGLDIDVPCDDQGHGTWTMGIMVGEDGDNEVGVAPEAKWIGCRNMEGGWGTPFTYLECFEFFLAPTDLNNENPDPSKAPHVINNSWGCPTIEGCNPDNWHLLETGVNNLKASGVFVVVSAGNDGGGGCSTIFNPASIFENSFSIGSTEINDTISGFSSRGPVSIDSSMRLKPNIVAPGGNIRSTSRSDGYTSGSGTSGSGPFVAGTVALMINANPALAGEVDILEDILEKTATPKTSDMDCGAVSSLNVPNNVYGHGLLNALAAVEMARTTTTTKEIAVNELSVYPNPTTDLLTIISPQSRESGDFKLFDAWGRVVKHAPLNSGPGDPFTISTSDLPNGIYYYQITLGGRQWTGRIVKT